MTAAEIQKAVDKLAKAMTAKGLRAPRAQINFESHKAAELFLVWKDARAETAYSDDKYKFIKGETLAKLISEAEAFIRQLPTAEETRMHEFMGALGKVIDLGRQNGVEADYLNPLVASMKKLSENIITHDRAA